MFENLVPPRYMTAGAAGCDLATAFREFLPAQERRRITTGYRQDQSVSFLYPDLFLSPAGSDYQPAITESSISAQVW